MNSDQERSIQVGSHVIGSCVGRETGDNTHVERDVIGGWSKDAAPHAVYSIMLNPEGPKSEEISHALHEALGISGPEADALLEGRVAVLMELDGTNHFLLVGFLRALGLYFSVATKA